MLLTLSITTYHRQVEVMESRSRGSRLISRRDAKLLPRRPRVRLKVLLAIKMVKRKVLSYADAFLVRRLQQMKKNVRISLKAPLIKESRRSQLYSTTCTNVM